MEKFKSLLDEIAKQKNSANGLSEHADPLQIATQYKTHPHAREIALLCALFSYGSATQIVKFLASLDFSALDAPPKRLNELLAGKKYRFQSSKDVREIFICMQNFIANGGVLGFYERFFTEHKKRAASNNADDIPLAVPFIRALISELYSHNKYRSSGYEFYFANAASNSALKRYAMWLRWMARKSAPDLGLLEFPTAQLLLPLDTHTHKMSLALGLNSRKQADIKAAINTTKSLKILHPDDPLVYDFALYRISQLNQKEKEELINLSPKNLHRKIAASAASTTQKATPQNRRVVIKIGSSSLAHANGNINLERIDRLAWVLSDLRSGGFEIILVSSGAIAIGSKRLGLATKPKDIALRQAASAVGQGALMQIYESAFSRLNQTIAQVLLTKDVITHEQMRENALNALNKLLSLGVIPIINENDAISTDELQGFSDNDQLSAYVAQLIGADLLVLLSDIDAVYDANPHTHKNAKPLEKITAITPKIAALADGASELGTGGMQSKFNAAKLMLSLGIDMFITNANCPENLRKILRGEQVGTLFTSKKDK